MATELDDAWDVLHAAAPRGWYVGRPSFHHKRNEWPLYAFDTAETRARSGSAGVSGRL
jgi:hypothetical protein